MLPLTGERTLPDLTAENYWFRRHEAAYLGLADEVVGPRVLEVGAGEGYGSALLARTLPLVIALDYDASAIGHLAARYPAVRAVRANLAALPVASGSVDTVLSLQVIEHVWDHPQFLAECHRVLRPGGRLVLSTPNRLTFSPGVAADAKPLNPFHTHEFTGDELSGLLSGCGFGSVRLRGLRAGPRLRAVDSAFAGGLVAAQLASPADRWPVDLADAVSAVTADDFVIEDEIGTSLDLIALARRP